MTTTTPWYWNTPDGGGWARYWHGDFIAPYGREDQERAAHPEAMTDYPGSRRPTPAERRAWRKHDAPAEGQTDAVEGAGVYEAMEE